MKTDFKIALWMASPILFSGWIYILAGIGGSVRVETFADAASHSLILLGIGVISSIVALGLGFLVTPFFYEEPTEAELKDPRLLNGKRFWKRIAAGCLYGIGAFIALLIYAYFDIEAAHRGESMMLGIIYGIFAVPCIMAFYSLWAFIPKKRELP